MEKYIAMLIVALVAGAFYGVSMIKKRKMYPACDRFAETYCQIMDRLLDDHGTKQSLLTNSMDGSLFCIRPIEEQPEALQAVLKKPIDDAVLSSVRELYFLRDDIQAQASTGSFSKDKYNAITNQVFDSLNAYLSIVQNPTLLISKKDLEQFHYVLQKQKHIRNTTLPAIASAPCAAKIAIANA